MALPKTAKAEDFETYWQKQYLFGAYLKQNASVLPTLVSLYGNTTLDGPLPDFTIDDQMLHVKPLPSLPAWYWAAKRSNADGEMYCPAREAARLFAAKNLSAFQVRPIVLSLKRAIICLRLNDI